MSTDNGGLTDELVVEVGPAAPAPEPEPEPDKPEE
jgi:hypothetical protein